MYKQYVVINSDHPHMLLTDSDVVVKTLPPPTISIPYAFESCSNTRTDKDNFSNVRRNL